MVALGGGAVSYERGTPVGRREVSPPALRSGPNPDYRFLDSRLARLEFKVVGSKARLKLKKAFTIRSTPEGSWVWQSERTGWTGGSGMRMPPPTTFRVWGLGFGVWGLGFGVWGVGFGVWGLGFGVWGLRLGFRV